MSFCTKCGKEIDETALFCKYCGTPVQASALQTKESSLSNEKSSKKIIVSLLAVVLLVGAVIFFFSKPSSPRFNKNQEIVYDYIHSVQKSLLRPDTIHITDAVAFSGECFSGYNDKFNLLFISYVAETSGGLAKEYTLLVDLDTNYTAFNTEFDYDYDIPYDMQKKLKKETRTDRANYLFSLYMWYLSRHTLNDWLKDYDTEGSMFLTEEEVHQVNKVLFQSGSEMIGK